MSPPGDPVQGKGDSSFFLPSSFSLALAMAEAGPGRSETVTETTVTVTTEPVSKAGGVMRVLTGVASGSGRHREGRGLIGL